MRNKLTDLNNYLFGELEKLDDEELTGTQLDEQIKKTKQITKVAQTIVNNNKLLLESTKVFSNNGYINAEETIKQLGLISYEV
jgi:hypothetical protein